MGDYNRLSIRGFRNLPDRAGVSTNLGALFFRNWRALEDDERDDFGIIYSATLTLLALIIGFSFSMAISRYDQRKNYEEAEAYKLCRRASARDATILLSEPVFGLHDPAVYGVVRFRSTRKCPQVIGPCSIATQVMSAFSRQRPRTASGLTEPIVAVRLFVALESISKARSPSAFQER